MSDSFQFKCPFCEQALETPLEAEGYVFALLVTPIFHYS